LDGTRTYLVGTRHVAVIDPGPLIHEHLDAVALAVEDAEAVSLLLTHAHGDHAAGAGLLADRLGVEVRGPGGTQQVAEGTVVGTDAGELVALSMPGHTEEHYCYGLGGADAVFVGDLLLGEGDTTWVGEYPGGVADYLASLDRLEALDPRVIYPGHGPPLTEPLDAIRRFRTHRQSRIDQVRDVISGNADASTNEILAAVYPDLPDSLHAAARRSIEVILDHLSLHE